MRSAAATSVAVCEGNSTVGPTNYSSSGTVHNDRIEPYGWGCTPEWWSWQSTPKTTSPAGAGPVSTSNRLLLAAREAEPSEADAEQRERGGFGNGDSPLGKCINSTDPSTTNTNPHARTSACINPDNSR